MRYFMYFVLVSISTGCAGRTPDLVPIVQPTDQVASCDQIMAEINANNQRMSDLAAEEGLKVTQNVAAGVIGSGPD